MLDTNMWIFNTGNSEVDAVNEELRNLATTAERVQEIFSSFVEPSQGGIKEVTFEDGFYTVTMLVYREDTIVLRDPPLPPIKNTLYFPKGKLAESQIELLESHRKVSDMAQEADKFILWAAGRAAVIAAVPIPLADVGPLMANEAYMIYRLADLYGFSIDKSVVTMLCGVAGGSIAGKLGASFLPFLKVPIAAGITYAVGKAAKAYFASGMNLSKDELVEVFTNARKDADNIDWDKKQDN